MEPFAECTAHTVRFHEATTGYIEDMIQPIECYPRLAAAPEVLQHKQASVLRRKAETSSGRKGYLATSRTESPTGKADTQIVQH